MLPHDPQTMLQFFHGFHDLETLRRSGVLITDWIALWERRDMMSVGMAVSKGCMM